MSEQTPQQAPVSTPRAQAHSSTSIPTLANCPSNDDERERRKRRHSRVADLQLSGSDSSLGITSPDPRKAEAYQYWTNAEISEHYSTCIKLSNENKITMKSAFGLGLIDCMADMLKQMELDLISFKTASGMLNASAKIYSVRVDAVHADAFKVLGGLDKDLEATEHTGSPAGEDNLSAAPEATKRVQKKKNKTVKTIEQNLDNINVSEAKRRYQVNPMFLKRVASFDACNTVGFFLRSTWTYGCSCELRFKEDIVPLPSVETHTLPSTEPLEMADLKPLLERCVEKRPICSSLAGFKFTAWDAESHDQSVSDLLDKFKKSNQVFNVDAEIDSDVKDSASALPGDDIQSDSPRNSVVEKIGEFSENLNSFGIVCQNKKTGVALSREGDISAISQHLSMKRGEYSYFSPQTLLSWAGPEHQQFKADAGTKRKTKKRSAKKAFEWNLDEDTDFKPYFRKAKTSTTLSKSVQERQKVKSITLPPQSNYDPDNFLQLFLQPTVKLNRISELGRVGDCEDEIDDYNYNNPNNTSNFCPDLQAADSDDNYSIQSMDQMGEFNLATDIEGENAEPNAINLTTRGELSLIAEPQKIKTTAIPYVKTAKKIDMSLLRKSMWDLLTNGQKEETVTEMDEEDTSVIAGEKAISSITKELLQTLPSQMAQNLSVPMVFACLLHLASEKNLILEGTEDLSDLLVKQGNRVL